MRLTPRAVLLVAAALPAALAPVFLPGRLWVIWIAVVAASIFVIGLDGLLGLAGDQLKVNVVVPETITIGEEGACLVEISIVERNRVATMEVLCDLDPLFVPQPSRKIRLVSGGEASASITLHPERRGELAVEAVWLRWTGPLGLISRQLRLEVNRPVAVVPNVRAVRSAALRFFSARHFLSGLKIQRYLGDGSEFDALREHVPGLDHRAIDWKASARHVKLLCREFRAERNQQVVMAIDTGHLMAEPLAGLPRLDHAVNASLLLAYFCLRMGDRVGFAGFDRDMGVFAEPLGGLGSFGRLQKLTSQLDYSPGETNFTLAMAQLSGRLKRRSLVVAMTDFSDTVTAELLVENLERLSKKQLVVFVALRDPELGRLASARPTRLGDLYRSVVATDFAREREAVLLRLRRLGILVVDAVPSAISAQLLNRYLEIKRRELI